jgi:two-component system, cell cycle sensor histidine kinase PleC
MPIAWAGIGAVQQSKLVFRQPPRSLTTPSGNTMQPYAVDVNRERAERLDGRARRQARRVMRRIIGAALGLVLCMWLFISWSLWSEYDGARASGWTEGANLSAALALDLTTVLDGAARALQRIDDGIKGLPQGASAGDVQAHLRQAAGAIAIAGAAVRIADPQGQVVASTLAPDRGPSDVRRQPHFIAHRDGPSDAMTIDPYVHDPAGPFVELSRRLESPDGHFAGEAILLLKPESLLTLHRELDIGRDGVIAISDTAGIVRGGFTRDHQDGSVGIGADLSDAPYPAALKSGELAFYSRRGVVAPIDRLSVIRGLQRYPLRVAVLLAIDEVLGSARTHIWLIGGAGILATMLLALLTFLLTREVWRRTRREIELAHDRDRLHLAQAQIEADRARLAQTNRELLASKERAEAANRARSQFLAHMSHELRTPLHAIIGFAELIKDQAPANAGSPPIAGYAADIWGSGRHLLELINAILDISKVESGTATLTETVFAVADLARTSLVSVRAQAEARNIAIDLELPDQVLRVRADRTRLLQVLINLLSNAVKFTPNDGRIVLAVEETALGELMFSVADSGIGMTAAEIEVALEPFGQVDSALSRSFEGTGLGLPLAQKLTDLHGGRLELTSNKGQGTTARVVLPRERLLQRDNVRIGGK